ncbi:MAG: toxic anion resistance protein [Gammaproteobacteria bacterium]|nr:toxic anion resistance protein [Gammaproteobacteria bacterium]
MTNSKLTPPEWADAPVLEKLKTKSGELFEKIRTETGPAMIRTIDLVGTASSKRMQLANDLMQKNVGDLLKGMSGESAVANRLVALRANMDTLNPHSLHNAWYFRIVPSGIKRFLIKRFVARYQSLQTNVDSIMNGLRGGKDELLQINIELEAQYREIQEAQRLIQADIYTGEILIEELEDQLNRDSGSERAKLETAINALARRIRDLRTKEQAAVQFFISIDQTIQTNMILGESIDSALTVGPMVMTNALRIQAALATQETVKNAVKDFQDGLGDLMAQNAKAVNDAAQTIGDMYNSPVIALSKLEEGFDNLMKAVNTANETMLSSTKKAREASAYLEQMTSELTPVAESLHAIEGSFTAETGDTVAIEQDKNK